MPMEEGEITVISRLLGISVWASDNRTAIKQTNKQRKKKQRSLLLIFVHFSVFPNKKHADTSGQNDPSQTQSEPE